MIDHATNAMGGLDFTPDALEALDRGPGSARMLEDMLRAGGPRRNEMDVCRALSAWAAAGALVATACIAL